VRQYKLRLELLAEGRLVEAMQVVTGGNSATAKTVDKITDAAAGELHDIGTAAVHCTLGLPIMHCQRSSVGAIPSDMVCRAMGRH
jgi:hypothetical protein